jgi:hypothetical protein
MSNPSRLHQLQEMLKAEPNDAFLNYAIAVEFEKEGRIHTYEESLKIEKEMENLIDELNLESIKIQATSDEKYISELVNKFL